MINTELRCWWLPVLRCSLFRKLIPAKNIIAHFCIRTLITFCSPMLCYICSFCMHFYWFVHSFFCSTFLLSIGISFCRGPVQIYNAIGRAFISVKWSFLKFNVPVLGPVFLEKHSRWDVRESNGPTKTFGILYIWFPAFPYLSFLIVW